MDTFKKIFAARCWQTWNQKLLFLILKRKKERKLTTQNVWHFKTSATDLVYWCYNDNFLLFRMDILLFLFTCWKCLISSMLLPAINSCYCALITNVFTKDLFHIQEFFHCNSAFFTQRQLEKLLIQITFVT